MFLCSRCFHKYSLLVKDLRAFPTTVEKMMGSMAYFCGLLGTVLEVGPNAFDKNL